MVDMGYQFRIYPNQASNSSALLENCGFADSE